MVWYVYITDEFGKNIRKFDIFSHYYFKTECDSAWATNLGDFRKFEENVKQKLAYYFKGKCEWELLISAWPPDVVRTEKKIDVYDQVMMNWNIFINILWDEYWDNLDKARKEEISKMLKNGGGTLSP